MFKKLAWIYVLVIVGLVVLALTHKEKPVGEHTISGLFIINTSGEVVKEIEGDFEIVEPFDDRGIAMMRKRDDDWEYQVFFVDKDFNVLGDRYFDEDTVMRGMYKGEEIFLASIDDGIEVLDESMSRKVKIKYNMQNVFDIEDTIKLPGENGLVAIKDPTCPFYSEKQFERWGYANIESYGTVVLDYVYQYAGPFSEEGVAVVKPADSDRYGAIDKDGEFVLDPVYVSLSDFHNGRAIGKREDQKNARLIDIEGNEYSTNRFKFGNVNPDDELSTVYDYYKEDYGFIDHEGEYAIRPNSDYIEVKDFKNGYAVVAMEVNDRRKWGVIDKQGKEVIKCEYYEILPPSKDGIVAIKQGSRYGFYSLQENRWIIEPKYGKTTGFYDGHAIVDGIKESSK